MRDLVIYGAALEEWIRTQLPHSYTQTCVRLMHNLTVNPHLHSNHCSFFALNVFQLLAKKT